MVRNHVQAMKSNPFKFSFHSGYLQPRTREEIKPGELLVQGVHILSFELVAQQNHFMSILPCMAISWMDVRASTKPPRPQGYGPGAANAIFYIAL